MLTPWQEARLRDAWCVELLEATSSAAALARAHADRRDGFPAYDPVPAVPQGPLLRLGSAVGPPRACARCGQPAIGPDAHHSRRYCSLHCRYAAHWARQRARAVA